MGYIGRYRYANPANPAFYVIVEPANNQQNDKTDTESDEIHPTETSQENNGHSNIATTEEKTEALLECPSEIVDKSV